MKKTPEQSVHDLHFSLLSVQQHDENIRKNHSLNWTSTDTTKENVAKVIKVLDNFIPILLEGNTGMGKSATIIEAAHMANRKLIRFNMSSHITIDDLLGKVTFDPASCNAEFKFIDGPFTTAFEKGYWILFDELNLAQDIVLQAIESALDTHQLIIQTASSAKEPIRRYRMHKDFRLFATQNPNSGFFKGKREKLSGSFLSRFRPIVFNELPINEWKQIIQGFFLLHFNETIVKHLSDRLILIFDSSIREKLVNEQNYLTSPMETGSYALFTIRELFKWANLLIIYKQKIDWLEPNDNLSELLSFSAWCVYGARYRREGRKWIEKILTDHFQYTPTIRKIKPRIDAINNFILFDSDHFRCPLPINSFDIITDQAKLEWDRSFELAGLSSIDYDDNIWQKATALHSAIENEMLNIEFISCHGIYRVDLSWLWEWLTAAGKENVLSNNTKFAHLGLNMYQSRFRHKNIHEYILHLFKESFKISFNKESVSEPMSFTPEIPFVLTDRVLSTLKQVAFLQQIKQPLLLTGDEGCGKSELLLTLGWFNSKRVYQVNITPETEPSSLIGQLIPNDSNKQSDKKFIWEHGPVTHAYINGHWVLLDNLGTAEPSVVERLNPVLEQDSELVLTESGDITKQRKHEDYQLIATMTTPSSFQQQISINSFNNELSPALYNRFTIVHMEDIPWDSENDQMKEMKDELLQYAKCLLSDERTDAELEIAMDICIIILNHYKKNRSDFPKLTLRNFIRLFNSAYLLQVKSPDKFDFISSLWAAFLVTIVNQIKNDTIKTKLSDEVKFGLQKIATIVSEPKIEIKQDTEHVLTESRYVYANAILRAVVCGIPLLLEGPAAVGKTTLISFLAKSKKIKLERVNNTDTTTAQDYLGTFLPVGNQFEFQPGALYRAMKNGWWFLADEFNLADPSVMNLLFPLLEGKKSIIIPSTGKIISAKEGFHFFATQNDASYADRHRLPVSLRNRFVEIQFSDFSTPELTKIILERNMIDNITFNDHPFNQTTAQYLADFYHDVINDSYCRITIRDLIKWKHRHSVLSHREDDWHAVGISFLCTKHASNSLEEKRTIDTLNKIFRLDTNNISKFNITKVTTNRVRFQENRLHVDLSCINLTDQKDLLWISNENKNITPPLLFRMMLIRIAFAIKSQEPVLLVGPSSCKTQLVNTWAKLVGRTADLITVHLTGDTEAVDLIGQIHPYSFLDIIKQLPNMAQQILQRFQSLLLSRTNDLPQEDKDKLNSIKKNITDKLVTVVGEFTHAYLQEENERQKKEQAYQDINNINPQPKHLKTIYLTQPKLIGDSHKNIQPLQYSNLHPYVRSIPIEDQETNDEFEIFNRYVPEEIEETSNGSNLDARTTTTMTFSKNNDDGFSFGAISGAESLPILNSKQFDDGFTTDIDDKSNENMQESLSAVNQTSSANIACALAQLINKTTFPDNLINTIDSILSDFENLFHRSIFIAEAQDATLKDAYSKFKSIWEKLNRSDFDRTKPIFLFKDGPVTRAAKYGGILFLEDLNLPSQAAIERLNSMFESIPTFTLTEDITCNSEHQHEKIGQLNIQILSNLQIFASIHQEEEHQLAKVSPSTRSRFTVIRISSYNTDELKSLSKTELIQGGIDIDQVDLVVETMFSLLQEIEKITVTKINIHVLFRWLDFITNHQNSLLLEHRIILGARFFLFDSLSIDNQDNTYEQWCLKNPSLWISSPLQYRSIFQLPSPQHGAFILTSNNKSLPCPFEIDIRRKFIALRYTGVGYSCSNTDEIPSIEELTNRFYCAPTPTFLQQIARIFAATSAKTPLLLEGPPGIGKTQVVIQVCKLLNKECERINLSANTSLDHLIGCIIPRYINGQRTFEWQDGTVLQALKAGHWILFDELNLASSEVLEGLAPLFYRSAHKFHVRTTDETYSMTKTRIFATMNPTKMVGGSRKQLPRSIQNLFTIVRLEDYNEPELRIILNNLFREEFGKKTIDVSELDRLFKLHFALKREIQQGHLGTTGGPFELNLRDLTKFRDVFCSSIQNQLTHYRYVRRDDDSKIEEREKTALSIRKFAQVVYACRFHGYKDFLKACDLINGHFKIDNSTLKQCEMDCTIDDSVPDVTRIGSIYIKTGTEESNQSNRSALIHTKQTMEQLELLAAACQSKRTILLEGDICSRKTSLVMELARVTRHRLVIIPMHENFDTSDLIGSWMPITTCGSVNNTVYEHINKLFNRIYRCLFVHCMPFFSDDENKRIFSRMKNVHHISANEMNEFKIQRQNSLQYEIESVQEMLQILNDVNKMTHIPSTVKTEISCFIRQVEFFKTKLNYFLLKQSTVNDQNNGISFIFVESEFVQAIRHGSWVLLDNVNSAPSEVLERLNSLTEDQPMISLYENSKGQKLTIENGGIHPNFRLFTTANLNRIYSNKLSPAFLNRVIHIWLPTMDDHLTMTDKKTLMNHDLYKLISTRFANIGVAQPLTHLLLLTHCKVKQGIKDKTLIYSTDFEVTYRLLDQSVQTILFLIHKRENPLKATIWTLIRSYGSSLSNKKQYELFIEQLRESLQVSLQLFNDPTVVTNHLTQNKQVDKMELIRDHCIELEYFLTNIIYVIIKIVINNEHVQKLFDYFLDKFLLRMKTSDRKILDIKQKLSASNANLSKDDLKKCLDELEQGRYVECPIQITNYNTVTSNMLELIGEAEKLKVIVKNLRQLLNEFIQETSFNDANKRQIFLQHVIGITEIFVQFFSLSSLFTLFNSSTTQLNTLISNLIQYLQPILVFKTILNAYEIFQNTTFDDARQQFRICVKDYFGIGLYFAFEYAQQPPIPLARQQCNLLIADMLPKDVSDRNNKYRPIVFYHLLTEWIGLQWTFETTYLKTNVRETLNKDICLTLDFIIRCEEVYCCSEIIKTICSILEETRKSLPPLNDQIEQKLQQIATNIVQKEARIKELQENIHAISSSESDQTVRYDQLRTDYDNERKDLQRLNPQYQACKKYRDNLFNNARQAHRELIDKVQKLMKSDDYQYLYDHFEQFDIVQLNSLLQFLCRLRKNTPNDPLDIRTTLSSYFSHRTVTNVDDLLSNPLIHFICVFFFLRIKLTKSITYISIISDWSQLIQDHQIDTVYRSIKLKDQIFFFYPNRNIDNCCLFTIENTSSKMTFTLCSVKGNINTSKLQNNLFSKYISIEQKKFDFISMTDDNQKDFSFNCLLFLCINEYQSLRDFYEQMKTIYEDFKLQIRRFTNETKTRRVTSKYLCPKIIQFSQQLEKYDTSFDTWKSVQGLIQMIDSQQETFSTNFIDNTDRELNNLIQTLQPLNKNSLLSRCLLKLLTSHVMYSGNDIDLLEQIYQATPDVINFLQNFFSRTLLQVDLKDGYLTIEESISDKNMFEEVQKLIKEMLKKLDFPIQFMPNLDRFVLDIIPLFTEPMHSGDEQSSSSQSHSTDLEIQSIERCIKGLESLLVEAKDIVVQPYHIILRIENVLHELCSIDISKPIDDTHLTSLLKNEPILRQLLKDYSIATHRLSSPIAFSNNREKILSVHHDDLLFTMHNTDQSNYETIFKDMRCLINKSMEATSFTELSKLIKISTNQTFCHTWIQTLNLLDSSMNSSMTPNLKPLKDYLTNVSVDLLLELDRENLCVVDETLANKIVLEYAQFRSNILIEQANKVSNYAEMTHLTSNLIEWKKKTKLHFLNMFRTLDTIFKDLRLVQHNLKSYSILLPIIIRPEDLLCLLSPHESMSDIRIVSARYTSIDYFLSNSSNPLANQSIPSESFHVSSSSSKGLSSFMYNHDQSKALFNQTNQLHQNLIMKATSVSHKLVNLCLEPNVQTSFLMTVATSIYELFPIHIATSIALLILTDWSSTCLEVCQQEHRDELFLGLLSHDEQKKHLYAFETQINELTDSCRRIEVKLTYINDKRKDVEDNYYNAKILTSQTEAKNELNKLCKDEETFNAELNDKHRQIEQLNGNYRQQREAYQQRQIKTQETWLTEAREHFNETSKLVRELVLLICRMFQYKTDRAILISNDASYLLNLTLNLARHHFLDFEKIWKNSPTDSDWQNLESVTNRLISQNNTLIDHSKKLLKKDTIYLFINFYCSLVQIAVNSLENSLKNCAQYSQILTRTSVMTYAKDRKNLFCNLNLWIREQCQTFLNDVRSGKDENEIIRQVKTISAHVNQGLKKMTNSRGSEYDDDHMKRSLYEFRQFISNLLAIGYRHVQVQRGTSDDSFEQVLKSVSVRHNFDSHLPRAEHELLQLLKQYENQLETYSESLLYQLLHRTFHFNTNAFALVTSVDRSLKNVIDLNLPSACIITEVWRTFDTLVSRMQRNMTNGEYTILKQICNDFIQMSHTDEQLNDECLFLKDRMKLINNLFLHIEQLNVILPKTRINTKGFLLGLMEYWREAIRGILQGLIRSNNSIIHAELEKNQRSRKLISKLFDTSEKTSIYVVHIEEVFNMKDLIPINDEEQTIIFEKMQRIQIFVQLLISGLENFEEIALKISLESLTNGLFQSYAKIIESIFISSKSTLLTKSLAQLLRSNNEDIDIAFNILDDIRCFDRRVFRCQLDEINLELQQSIMELVVKDIKTIIDKTNQTEDKWFEGIHILLNDRENLRDSKKILKIFKLDKTLPVTDIVSDTFKNLLKYIRNDMYQSQFKSDQISRLPSQTNLRRLIQLSIRFGNRYELKRLQMDMFDEVKNVFQLKILQPEQGSPIRIINIIFTFTGTNQQEQTITLQLTEKSTEILLGINSSVDSVTIPSNSAIFGPDQRKWPTLIDSNEWILWNKLKVSVIQCSQQEDVFYIAKNVPSSDSISRSASTNQPNIDEELNRFETLLQGLGEYNEDLQRIKDSIHNKWMENVFTIIREIVQIANGSQSVEFERLSDVEYLTKVYQNLPKIDHLSMILKKLLNITRKNEFSPLELYDLSGDILSKSITSIWNEKMNTAYTAMVHLIQEVLNKTGVYVSQLCRVRTQMALSYAVTNKLSEDGFAETDFVAKLKDCDQLYCILQSNDTNKQVIADCKRIANEAERICQKTYQSTNNWTRVEELITDDNLLVDDNLTECFLESKLGQNVPIWCDKIINADRSIIIRCEPKQVLLDFGIAVNGTHQNTIRYIIVHNQLTSLIKVKIERQTHDDTKDAIFDLLIKEPVSIAAHSHREIGIQFKSPSIIGFFNENWMITIDNQTIEDFICLNAEIVEVDVDLETTKIDFGTILCECDTLEKTIQLKNHLPKQVHITAELRTPNPKIATLILPNKNFFLPPNSTYDFMLKLNTSNIEESFQATIYLFVGITKTRKVINVSACTRRPQLSIRRKTLNNFVKIDNEHQSVNFNFDDLYRGQQRQEILELKNIGEVGYFLQLLSNDLSPQPNHFWLDVGSIQQIETIICMSENDQNRNFVLEIRFLQTKYHPSIVRFICETTIAILDKLKSIRHEIKIFNTAEKDKQWDEHRECLIPIEIPLTLKNAGKASAVISLFEVLPSGDSRYSPLALDLRVEPNQLEISGRSEETVKIVYRPYDLRTLRCIILVKTNYKPYPQVDYNIIVNMPNLATQPRSVINIGLIKCGEINVKKDLLLMVNKGQYDVHFTVKTVAMNSSFVKKLSLKDSLSSSDENTTCIQPQHRRSFSIIVECENIDMSNSFIELGQIELESLSDLVMSIDGRLVNRTIQIFVYGQTKESVDVHIINERQRDSAWENLRLVSSSEFIRFYENSGTYLTYRSLASMTLAAWACRSTLLEELPKEHDKWVTCCTQLITHSKQNHLTFDDFSDHQRRKTIIDVLNTTLKNSLQKCHHIFYYHSIQPDNLFEKNDFLRLQLLSIINSARDIDEQYTMQSYIMLISYIYEKFSINDNACRQTFQLINQCIGKDPLIPKSMKIFIDYIREMTKNSINSNNIEQLIYKCISPQLDIYDLFDPNQSNFKWSLRYEFFSQSIKNILSSLLAQDHQILIDCYQNTSLSSREKVLLDIMKQADKKWSEFSVSDRARLFNELLFESFPMMSIFSNQSLEQQIQADKYFHALKIIFDHFNCSNEFSSIDELFKQTRENMINNIEKRLNIDRMEACILATNTSNLKQKRLNSPTTSENDMDGITKDFLCIIEKFVSLEANQWRQIKSYLPFIWKLLWQDNQKTTSIADIAMTIMTFNRKVDFKNKYWTQLRYAYKQHRDSNRSWKTMNDYLEQVTLIGSIQSSTTTLMRQVTDIIKKLTTANSKENVFQYGYELALIFMSENERENLNKKFDEIEVSLKRLNNDEHLTRLTMLKTIQPYVSETRQKLIQAYIDLVDIDDFFLNPDCSTTLSINHQHLLKKLDSIVESWLILSEESFSKTRDIFKSISSLLVSFYGLLISKENLFQQHICMTTLTVALARLAYLRLNSRFSSHENEQTRQKTQTILQTIQAYEAKPLESNRQQISTNVDDHCQSSSNLLLPPSLESQQDSLRPLGYSTPVLESMLNSVKEFLNNPQTRLIDFYKIESLQEQQTKLINFYKIQS
ncbi:unnamed protein product, partial [Rotaria sordida]